MLPLPSRLSLSAGVKLRHGRFLKNIFMPSPLDGVGEGIVFSGCPSATFVRSFVRPFGQILLPRYLMNGLSNLNETNVEYSIAPTGDMFRFWSSKVKGQGHSRPSKWRRYPRRR